MPTQNNRNSLAAQRLKRIRKFVDFDYDLRKPLTPYAQSKIRKYAKEVDALTARPHQVYRPRREDRLEKAQEFAQHQNKLSGLKVAFIPTNGEEKRKIKFDSRGGITAVSEHVSTRIITVDPTQFGTEDDTKEYIKQLIATEPNAKSFTILAGAFEIPEGHSRRSIVRAIAQLANQYRSITADGDKANNHYENWLHGIGAHTFDNQETFQDYQSIKKQNKDDLRRKRRNAKRREQRNKNK